MKEIKITITKKGEVTTDLLGFQGQGCGDLQAKITAALGTKLDEDTKPEFYEQETESVYGGCS
jgi:ketol-acid reductoisomerase